MFGLYVLPQDEYITVKHRTIYLQFCFRCALQVLLAVIYVSIQCEFHIPNFSFEYDQFLFYFDHMLYIVVCLVPGKWSLCSDALVPTSVMCKS